jgi:hypothetical protein
MEALQGRLQKSLLFWSIFVSLFGKIKVVIAAIPI